MPAKLYTTFLLLSLFSSIAIAQETEWSWANAMGSDGTDAAYSIAIDHESSDVYTTGWFAGTVDFDPGDDEFNLTSAGGQDIFISRLDSAGNFIWAVAMGGTSNDVAYSIALDHAGSDDLYITGWFSETADFDPGENEFNLTSAGLTDIFVSRLDASGNFVWAKSTGHEEYDGARSVAIDPAGSGDVYTTGYFAGTVDFDPGDDEFSITAISDSDIFITKLDASGNFVWTKAMGGSNDDGGYSIALDASAGGSVYTTGSFTETVDFDPGTDVFELEATDAVDMYISKLDAQGNFVWAKSMGGNTSTVSYAIAIDTATTHAVYTTGAFRESVDFNPGQGTFNLTSAGWRDVFISKLDSDGNFIWAKGMGGEENDKGYSIALDPAGSGDVFLTGEFIETADFDPGDENFELTSAGQSDLFISKLDSSGIFIWAKAVGGTGNDYGQAIAPDTLGNAFITGYFESETLAFGNTTLENPDGNGFYADAFVAGLFEVVVGIENIESENGISIYPNPATHQLAVSSRQSAVGSLEIYDVLGKEIFQTDCNTATCKLQTAAWPRGIYFVKIITDEYEVMKKVVVE